MATADLSWLEFSPGLTAQVSWLEFSTPPPSITAAVSWLQFDPPSGAATASVSWLEFSAPGAAATYTLTAEAGAYTMTWAGSTGQVVLEAEAGAYTMTEQDANLLLVADGGDVSFSEPTGPVFLYPLPRMAYVLKTKRSTFGGTDAS